MNLIIGVLSAVIAVVLMQAWPPRYRWSTDVSLTTARMTGRPVHEVKLMRRRRRIWKGRRSPMDLTFNARVAVLGLGRRPGDEKIVPVPIAKDWRPVVSRSVLVSLMPELCREADLRYFPDDVRARCREGTLRLEDLLSAGTSATLRVYVFAYRPYVGTRWMRRGCYDGASIKAGYFKRGTGVVEMASGDEPPVVDDLLSVGSTPPRTDPNRAGQSQPHPWVSWKSARWEFVIYRQDR